MATGQWDAAWPDLGVIAEYRGVWDPSAAGGDPSDQPPALPMPPRAHWGWVLVTSGEVDGHTVFPTGIVVAESSRGYGDPAQATWGDWSQPGLLWSYVDPLFAFHGDPQPPA